MIAQYEAEARQSAEAAAGRDPLVSPRQYGITQTHKHLPEIMAMTGLAHTPGFLPVVADYYSGMEVIIPIQAAAGRDAVMEVYRNAYQGQPLVQVAEAIDDGGFIAANRLAGTNKLELTVAGNDDNILLAATYDNLGKGASGAAIQNMNIMLGLDETKGLV